MLKYKINYCESNFKTCIGDTNIYHCQKRENPIKDPSKFEMFSCQLDGSNCKKLITKTTKVDYVCFNENEDCKQSALTWHGNLCWYISALFVLFYGNLGKKIINHIDDTKYSHHTEELKKVFMRDFSNLNEGTGSQCLINDTFFRLFNASYGETKNNDPTLMFFNSNMKIGEYSSTASFLGAIIMIFLTEKNIGDDLNLTLPKFVSYDNYILTQIKCSFSINYLSLLTLQFNAHGSHELSDAVYTIIFENIINEHFQVVQEHQYISLFIKYARQLLDRFGFFPINVVREGNVYTSTYPSKITILDNKLELTRISKFVSGHYNNLVKCDNKWYYYENMGNNFIFLNEGDYPNDEQLKTSENVILIYEII